MYNSFEGLDSKQKEKLLKNNLQFQEVLSQKELSILENALKRQFQTNIFVYSLCGFLLLAGIGLFIYQGTLPKPLHIDNIEIQDTDSTARKILVDLDPVTVTWTINGQDEEVFAVLENVSTGQQTKKIRVQASEGKVVFPSDRYDNYDKILNNRQPLQSNRIRAIIFGRTQSFKSREFQLKVGVRLFCLGTQNGNIDFFVTVDNTIVDNYHYLPKLTLFRGTHFDEPVFFEGKELAARHTFKVPNPENINPNQYILAYSNPQDDRIVRSEVDLEEFYKLRKKGIQ